MAVSWVKLAIALVAYKKQVFSLLTKHVDLSQITWPLSQSVNCTAIIVVILFWVFRSIGGEGPLLTRAENFSYKQTRNTYNAVFPQVIWMFWLHEKIASHLSSILSSGLNCFKWGWILILWCKSSRNCQHNWLMKLCRVFGNIR